MKLTATALSVPILVLVGSACVSGSTGSAKAGMRVHATAGPRLSDSLPATQEVSIKFVWTPFLIALVDAAIDFGLEEAKAALESSAAKYEVKTDASVPARVGVSELETLADIPRLERYDTFAVARALTVDEGEIQGALVLPPKDGLPLGDWVAESSAVAGYLDGLETALTISADCERVPWSRQESWARTARLQATQLLYDLAPLTAEDERETVVSFVAICDTTYPAPLELAPLIGSPVPSGHASGYQLALRAYDYPVALRRKGDATADKQELGKVKSILSVALAGPGGYGDAGVAEYLHTATFQVKPDAVRKDAGWVVPKECAGWIARESGLGAPPPSVMVNATAQLLETNNLKKTLERLAKLVGKVSLDADDLGID